MIYLPARSTHEHIWLILGDIPTAARLDILPAPGQIVSDTWNRARISLPVAAHQRKANVTTITEVQNYLKDRHGFDHVGIDFRPDVDPPPHLVAAPASGSPGVIYLSSTRPIFTVGIRLKGHSTAEVLKHEEGEPIAPFVAEEHHADFLAERDAYLDLAARKIIGSGALPPELAFSEAEAYLHELWTATPDIISPLWRG